MSKLDRFLVSIDWMELYSEVCQLALSKLASDHCSILLDSRCDSWGPTPIRLELVWMEEQYFSTLERDWWKDISVDGWLATDKV